MHAAGCVLSIDTNLTEISDYVENKLNLNIDTLKTN